MDKDNSNEKPGVSEAKGSTDSGRRTETVNVVDMGSVLTETKGYLRGLELNYTPRSG